MGRILGIDYGDVRVGVALSDPTHLIASAYTVVPREHDEQVVEAILALCAEQDVERVVVGLPLNMDGTRGPAVAKVETFVTRLISRADVPVTMVDERLSTLSAQRTLRETGVGRDQRKGLVDKLAAQAILQTHLDAACFEIEARADQDRYEP